MEIIFVAWVGTRKLRQRAMDANKLRGKSRDQNQFRIVVDNFVMSDSLVTQGIRFIISTYVQC